MSIPALIFIAAALLIFSAVFYAFKGRRRGGVVTASRFQLWRGRRHLKKGLFEKEGPSCPRCHEELANWGDDCISCERDRTNKLVLGLDPDDNLPIGGGQSTPTWEMNDRPELPDEDLSGLFSGLNRDSD